MQSYTPSAPALNSLAVSQLVRDNLNSLASNNSGAALPGYAVEGTLWYDSTAKRMKTVKQRGSKAYAGAAAGPTLTIHASIRAAGVDGSTINADIRVQNSVLIPSGNHDWTQVAGPVQRLFFLNTKVPSQFAATYWNDPLIDDPVIISNDGILLGKNWETLIGNENIYYAGPMTNESGFATTTLKAIDIEQDPLTFKIEFALGAANQIDHVVFPLTSYGFLWSDFQESGGAVLLLENGVELPSTAYKATFFVIAGVPQVIIYRINSSGLNLMPFTSLGKYTLRIRKPS